MAERSLSPYHVVGPAPSGALVAPRRHRPRRRRVDWWLVWFTIVGLALRLATIDTRGLWLDEALTVRQAKQSIPEIIASLSGGVHPPFFHILMHYWVSLVGTAEAPVRVFALIFGVASIPVAYWVGMRMFDLRVARISAGLLALWPYHIWYSQEARMYSMLMFFGLLSVGCLYMAMERGGFWRWTAFWFVTTLGAFVHYFFLFLIFGEALYFIFYEVIGRELSLRRNDRPRASLVHPLIVFSDIPSLGPWLVANGLVVAAMGAWSVFAVFGAGDNSALLNSVSSGGLGYGQAGASFAIRFNDIGTMVTESVAGFHSPPMMYAMVAMWPLAIYVLLLLFDLMGPMRRRTRLLLWSASGIPMVWMLGMFQGQVLTSRYFMPLLAPVLILVAAVIAWMPDRTRKFVLAAGLVLALVAYADQSFNPNNLMRYDNRLAIGSVAAHFKPGDTIIFEPFYTDALFEYYLPKELPAYGFPQYGENGSVRDAKVEIGEDLQRVTGDSKRVWLILSFQNIEKLRGDAYNTEMWFLRHGYKVAETHQYNQVQVIRYDAVGATGTAASTHASSTPARAGNAGGVPATTATGAAGGVRP